MRKFVLSVVIISVLFSCTEEKPELIEQEAPVSIMSINLSGNEYDADHGRQLKHDLTGIYVTIRGISVLKDDQWTKIPGDFPQLVNLIDLSSKEMVLATMEIDPGKYAKIKFDIDQGNNKVIMEGKGSYVKNIKGFVYPLKVPSSEIKVTGDFEVREGFPHKLIVDFDITESIKQLGNKEDYMLKPVVKLKILNEIGFIKVSLADSFPKGKYKAMVYKSGKVQVNDIITKSSQVNSALLFSTKLDEGTSSFIVPNLPSGIYDIFLAADSSGNLEDKISTGIKVKTGEITKVILK